jgi:hypothetical protein
LDGDVDLRAGGVTVFDSSNPEGKPVEWLTGSEYKLGLEMQMQRRQAIKDACFTDAFKLLNSAPLLDKQMTAFEVSQRQTEQLQNMTPVDARHIQEFHNPLMHRVFGVMFRRGKFGRPPQVIQEQLGQGKEGTRKPEIVATSRFVDAQKALKNRGTQETFEFVAPIAEKHPELGLYDNFIMDDVAVNYSRNTGMAPDLIRAKTGPNSVAALRAQRAKVAQQQRGAEMAETLGKAGKALGGSPDWMQDQVKQQVQGGRKRAA